MHGATRGDPMRHHDVVRCSSLVFTLTIAGLAAAQDPPKVTPVQEQYTDKPEFKDDSKRKQGWSPSLVVAATGAFANNTNVVGQPDGSTLTMGFKLDAGIELNRGKHEW